MRRKKMKDVMRYLRIWLAPRWFREDFKEFKKQRGNDRLFELPFYYPIFKDRKEEGGVMKGIYFFQDLFVARQIYLANPKKHLDIGSRTDGFVAHVASFREIELIDIREIKESVENIKFRQGDLMKLSDDLIGYCDSVSSLHAIEHFGLGRYGDPVDYFGYIKAIQNIHKILTPGGTFYFSVPIGPQRIEFNAHRVFSVEYLLSLLKPYFEVQSFSYVDDAGNLHREVALLPDDVSASFNCWYGCGIFVLRKINE